MFEKKSVWILFLLIILLALVSYFSGLFIDVTRDAGKYATVSKEIFQNGNFINLTVHGDPYDQKPPLLFWLGALGFSIGGLSNFWFKFPVLLLVFAGIYWAFRLGQTLYNKRVGYLTATFLFFSFIYSLYSMDIHTDTPLQAFVTLALWQLFEFIKTRKTRNWFLGFFAIGLAMLSKGPIGAALPAFAVVGHIVLKKDFRFLLHYKWYLGIILSFLVVSPALIGLINQFGWKGIQFFFWDNNVGRITGSYVQANNDPIFYVHNLIYQFLPWSILFFISVFAEFRMLIIKRFKSAEYFTFAGIWIYFFILNSASSQLPNYVFGIIPLIAVLTAKWVDLALSEKTKLWKVFFISQNVMLVFIWLLIFGIGFYIFPQPGFYFWILSILGMCAILLVLYKSENKEVRLILPSTIVISLLFLLLNTSSLPYVFSFQAPPKAARYFTENKSQNDVLYNYKYGQYELFFYSEPQAKQLDNFDEVINVAGKKGNWIFTNPEGLSEINQLNFAVDTIIEYQHLYLNRPAKFIHPKTRGESLQPLYLIKY